ncbi:MAG: acyl-CoA thioesterase [Flavobacteriales bacterium]|nr:acyl-CoA thioesterase [Flavobacteriales bacterium]
MKHISSVEVRFSDIDAMGHVNNAVFLNYFEEARIEFFKATIGEKWDWRSQGIVLARNEIDYMLPILLTDEVKIETRVEKIGGKSMTLSYSVYNGLEGEQMKRFAHGRSIIVAFDYAKGQPKEIPESWRAAFNRK